MSKENRGLYIVKSENEPRSSRQSTKKFIILTLTSAVVVIIAILVITQVTKNHTTNPNFPAILPSGKSIGELGGWKRLNPPGNDPVFSYNDTVGKVRVSVTEQALPKSFQPNVADKVAELAKNYNASTTVEADGLKVYIGTSAKGPQSVIFVKHNVLVLIKSQSKISDTAWAHYATSLISTETNILPTF